MKERHKYEYEVVLESDTAPARVVGMVGKNKRVLEIGSGPGSITKKLTAVSNCRVTALDIDAEAIKKILPFCERAYQANLNDSNWPEVLGIDNQFDVVVAADVLEHVYHPLTVLGAMKGLINETGYLVISLPHVAHSVIHACLFDEDFDYGEFGLLDRTHIRFFGIKNIQKLFEDAGLKIIHAEFSVRNPEFTEFSKRWVNTDPELRKVLAKNPFGSVYQVVVKAVPLTAEGEALVLMDLPVERQRIAFADRVKSFLRLHLSKKFYALLQNVYASGRKHFLKNK